MEAQRDARVERLASPRECSIFEKNARDRGRDDLAQQARQRWVELSADARVAEGDDDEPLHHELWRALAATESLLGHPATGTRQVIRRRGLVRAAEQLATRDELSTGLAALADAGLLAYAWEHVVLRHPGSFSEAATRNARARLEAFDLEKDRVPGTVYRIERSGRLPLGPPG